MKYNAAPTFVTDWARLSRGEQDAFLAVIRKRFNLACERYTRDPSTPWTRSLRVKRVQGTPSVWEMTWSFAGPDGRATFEWIEVGGEPAIQWRRIGGHEILGRP